jgi:hypothetical protein
LWIDTVDQIQKALEAFLQKKIPAFPRFYFLSNENLLFVVGEFIQASPEIVSRCGMVNYQLDDLDNGP